MSFNPTPRKVTLASVPVSILGTFTTVTSSFDSSALPLASLASPGALLMVSTSERVRLLLSSASEPPRKMITRSARPLSASVCRNPAPIASTETNTPDHTGDADDDDAGGADALRQGLQAHSDDGGQLLEHGAS